VDRRNTGLQRYRRISCHEKVQRTILWVSHQNQAIGELKHIILTGIGVGGMNHENGSGTDVILGESGYGGAERLGPFPCVEIQASVCFEGRLTPELSRIRDNGAF